MKYVRPDVYVERFVTDRTIASTSGCEWVDPTNPTATTVECVIGKQKENVFSDSRTCGISVSNWFIVDDYKGTTADYFVWYTGSNDNIDPQNADTGFLEELVLSQKKDGIYSSGKGWHYAAVNTSSTNGFYNDEKS